MSVHEKMTAIADTVRSHTGKTEKLTLDQLPGQIHAACAVAEQTGYQRGLAEGDYNAGVEAGEDAFWDAFQNAGKRTDYRYAFFYTGFSHLDPKWPIKATNAENIVGNVSDLKTVNWEKFDLSKTSSLYNAFGFCNQLIRVDTELGASGSAASLLNSIFRNCSALRTVKKLTAYPAAVWKQSFDECRELTHIIFGGTIGASGLNMQWSTKLDRESIESIIGALSPSATGQSITLSLTAVDNAFYEEATIGSESAAWRDLSNSKGNWTITLV